MTDSIFYHHAGPMYDDGSHIEPEGWYFWCEDECSYIGPMNTREECAIVLKKYAESL